MYASVYRLYEPSFFADPSYEMTGFDKKTSEAIYTMRFKMKEYSGFRPIYARNPFANRTHVLSNPSLSQGGEGEDGPTVFKEQFCRIGRRFDEPSILTKIHGPKNVPGVVEAVLSESNEASTLSPERKRYFLGLRQTGSPLTSIPTAKKMLETLFDLLEVLRFLYFERRILHRDISAGNVMYIENPEDPQKAVEQLVFAKHLLGESDVRYKTSLLLVDFNLGEDLDDRTDRKRIERTGTPVFISRAVERGSPVPLIDLYHVPAVPKIPTPTCYSECHPERIERFPENTGRKLIDPDDLKQSQGDSSTDDWKHELDYDVESVFWLVVYWAMVMQPKGQPGGYIGSPTWGNLIGDSEHRDLLLVGLSRGSSTLTLTHAVYNPLCSLIQNLAKVLMVDRHWLPETSVQNQPDYICEAFQRIILEFITLHRDEDFMTCPVGDSLRQTRPNAQSQALSITASQARDGSERAAVNELKRRRLNSGTKDEDNYHTDDDQMDDSV